MTTYISDGLRIKLTRPMAWQATGKAPLPAGATGTIKILRDPAEAPNEVTRQTLESGHTVSTVVFDSHPIVDSQFYCAVGLIEGAAIPTWMEVA